MARLVLYADLLFVAAMVALTAYLLITPPIISQTCSSTNSSTWAFLTILAAGIGMVGAGLSVSEL